MTCGTGIAEAMTLGSRLSLVVDLQALNLHPCTLDSLESDTWIHVFSLSLSDRSFRTARRLCAFVGFARKGGHTSMETVRVVLESASFPHFRP